MLPPNTTYGVNPDESGESYIQEAKCENGVTTNPLLSDRHCQAQHSDKSDVITATTDENGAKKTTEEMLDTTATTMGWCDLMGMLT